MSAPKLMNAEISSSENATASSDTMPTSTMFSTGVCVFGLM